MVESPSRRTGRFCDAEVHPLCEGGVSGAADLPSAGLSLVGTDVGGG